MQLKRLRPPPADFCGNVKPTRTNKHLVGLIVRVIRFWTAKQRPETCWELTPGYKSCNDERSAVKRHDRPFSHSAECNERLADFRARFCNRSCTLIEMVPLLSGPSVETGYPSTCSQIVMIFRYLLHVSLYPSKSSGLLLLLVCI